MRRWANEGLGQYLMDDKPGLIRHIKRHACIDAVNPPGFRDPWMGFAARPLDSCRSPQIPASNIHQAGRYSPSSTMS